jgi:hypothetical protein
MSDKTLLKDFKMLLIEEHFNDLIEDLLWRLRQIERKSIDDITKILSGAGVSVSYEEVSDWLNYLDADILIPQELVKPDPNKKAPPPKKKGNVNNGVYDPNSSSPICGDDCPSAAMCKFYAHYYGKRCVVDTQAKKTFLQPLKNYIGKTYGRDEDLKQVFFNFAEQVATINQLMQRKIRHMNTQGITVIERKTDPSTGKLVENEVPNPLNSAILSDSKQIMSMLKEMGMTPKSLINEDSGENDPASLSKAMEMEERRRLEQEHLTEVKKERYKQRPEISSKEQLLALIEEKKDFNQALQQVLQGEDVVEVDPPTSAPMSSIPRDEQELQSLLDNNEKADEKQPSVGEKKDVDSGNIVDVAKKILEKKGNKVFDDKRNQHDVEIPPDVQSIIDKIGKSKGD